MSGPETKPAWWHGRARWLLVVAGVLGLDQLTKLIVTSQLSLHETVTVIPGFFDITYMLNTGGVWGLGRDLPPAARTAIFLALPAAITVFALWYSLQLSAADRLRQSALALVVGGAIGNLVDRLTIEKVIDFLLFHVGDKYWPTFNVADSAICIGIGVLMVATVLEPEEDDDEVGAAAPSRRAR